MDKDLLDIKIKKMSHQIIFLKIMILIFALAIAILTFLTISIFNKNEFRIIDKDGAMSLNPSYIQLQDGKELNPRITLMGGDVSFIRVDGYQDDSPMISVQRVADPSLVSISAFSDGCGLYTKYKNVSIYLGIDNGSPVLIINDGKAKYEIDLRSLAK
jgi:hypothetical protein